MKKWKFTEQQIIFAIRQAENGVRVEEICRFRGWQLRRLRQLEEDNRRLKQIVADLSLDMQMLQDILKKMFESPTIENTGSATHRSVPRF